jgi:hypothetical protein
MYRIGMWSLILVACCGCPGTDNPASVLEGTWQLVFEEPGDLEGFDIQATFDADGQLVEITAESPEGGTASLTLDDETTTEVEDGMVTITIPAAGGTRVYEGTLSDDENTIEGSLSQELELSSGDLDVTLPGSGLTLERIES